MSSARGTAGGSDLIISKSRTKDAVRECNISGDFYEVVTRAEGEEFVLFLADVSGKGMSASLLTAVSHGAHTFQSMNISARWEKVQAFTSSTTTPAVAVP